MNIQRYVEEKLREQGYKITRQRKGIIEVFSKNPKQLLNVQQVYDKVKKNHPSIDFSTVYRNIELLEEQEMIHKINIGQAYACYKFKETSQHHHHMICKKCGKTEIITFCPFQQVEEQFQGQGFLPTEHNFEVLGYCANCQCKIKKQ